MITPSQRLFVGFDKYRRQFICKSEAGKKLGWGLTFYDRKATDLQLRTVGFNKKKCHPEMKTVFMF